MRRPYLGVHSRDSLFQGDVALMAADGASLQGTSPVATVAEQVKGGGHYERQVVSTHCRAPVTIAPTSSPTQGGDEEPNVRCVV